MVHRKIRYLTLKEAIQLHERLITQSGGLGGLLNANALEAALQQPRQTFDGKDLYPSIIDKAAAMAFSLILNHPFLDGNKRLGHAAMEVFLLLNGFELNADVDEQEHIILAVAAGDMHRADFTAWLREHVTPRP
ncbi:MAG: type II toxin-antitoxin system death-on-curing family toxin [Caldilinea sp.]